MTNIDLRDSIIKDVDFNLSNLTGVKLLTKDVDLGNINLLGTNLTNVDLSNIKLENINMSSSTLTGADLTALI